MMIDILRYIALVLGIACFVSSLAGIIGFVLCLLNRIGIPKFKYFIPIIGIKYLIEDSKELNLNE